MIGKPSSPTNVANALKEAKKAERAEKEYHVRLPKNKRSLSLSSKHSKRDMEEEAFERFSEDHDAQPQVVHDAGYQGPPPSMKRGKSMGNSPTFSHTGMPNMHATFKKTRSMGQADHIMSATHGQQHQPPSWHSMPNHHQSAGRSFNMMPYGGHSGQHMMGGGYPAGPGGYGGMQSRYPLPDSVPTETVRRLLLGQLDPVELALQILPPEEAAVVARRHASSGLAPYTGGMMEHISSRGPPAPGGPIPSSAQPLPLATMVSDGSFTSAESAAMRRTQSDATVTGQGGGCGDDGSSIGSKQSNTSTSERALPKKKRKIVI